MTGLSQHSKSYWAGDEGLTNEGAIHLIYSAYINACLSERINEDISFDEMYEAVDELCKTPEGLEDVKKYYELFLKSKPMVKMNEEVEKKKQEVMSDQTLPQ